jgi:hypothetical protein
MHNNMMVAFSFPSVPRIRLRLSSQPGQNSNTSQASYQHCALTFEFAKSFAEGIPSGLLAKPPLRGYRFLPKESGETINIFFTL